MADVTRSGRKPSTVLVWAKGLIAPVQNLSAIASPSITPMPMGHLILRVRSIASGREISMTWAMPWKPELSSCTRQVTR